MTDVVDIRDERGFPSLVNRLLAAFEAPAAASLSSTQCWVLVAVAESANPDGTSCHPSIEKIMSRTHLSRRTIIKALDVLGDSPWLAVEHRRGARNRYTVFVPDQCTRCTTTSARGAPVGPDQCTRCTTTSARGALPPVHEVHTLDETGARGALPPVHEVHPTHPITHRTLGNQVAAVSDQIPWAKIQTAWNDLETTAKKKPIRAVTEARRRALRPLVKEFGLGAALVVFGSPSQSGFLRGEAGNAGWQNKGGADFDFFCNRENFIKTLEGKYADPVPRRHIGAGKHYDPKKMSEDERQLDECWRATVKHINGYGLKMLELRARNGISSEIAKMFELHGIRCCEIAQACRKGTRGVSEGEFYDAHDVFCDELYQAMSPVEQAQIDSGLSLGGATGESHKRTIAAQRRKQIRQRFGLSNPLDLEIAEEDLPG